MCYAPDVLAIMLNIDSSYDTCDSDDGVPLGVDLGARVVQSLLGLKLISCSCSQQISGPLEVMMNCLSHWLQLACWDTSYDNTKLEIFVPFSYHSVHEPGAKRN